MDIKPRPMSSIDLGGVKTEPQSTSFEVSSNEVEVGIWQHSLLFYPLLPVTKQHMQI